MAKLYDGKRVVDVKMYENRMCDYSYDFYDVGGLQYDEAIDAYYVDDVEYCLDQADDWVNLRGDYESDIENLEREIIFDYDIEI